VGNSAGYAASEQEQHAGNGNGTARPANQVDMQTADGCFLR